ncbi:MAG: B12-binding domain-containing protein [Hydrogenophilales bacterium]|nr:B12-binding domain-containing protein [Hydrogenophilales bacterium]
MACSIPTAPIPGIGSTARPMWRACVVSRNCSARAWAWRKSAACCKPARRLPRRSPNGRNRPRPPARGRPAWEGYLRETLRALEDFSTERLDAIYNEACAVYPIDMLTRHVLIPVLERIGERWDTRPSGIAEEHFFSAWLRNKLGARLHHTSGLSKGRPLLLACLPHEVHEIGLLLFALGALHRGFRVVYLGGNVPIRQLIHVAGKSHVAGVVLSGRDAPDAAALLEDIAWLTGAARAPVFVGSHFSVRQRVGLIRANAVPLGDNIVAGLNLLEARLARSGVSRMPGA